MTDLSRRSFLRGVLTVTAGAVLPAMPAFAAIPVLHGDGFTDDTEALQALFDGRPFRTLDSLREGFMAMVDEGVLYLRGGSFAVSKTINVHCGKDQHLMITDCSFMAHQPLDDAPIINITGPGVIERQIDGSIGNGSLTICNVMMQWQRQQQPNHYLCSWLSASSEEGDPDD